MVKMLLLDECEVGTSGVGCGKADFVMLLRMGLVDRMFLRVWSRCPLDVAMDFGRCLRMLWTVRHGKVDSWLFLTALHNVETEGLHRDWCTHLRSSSKLEVGRMWLAW